MLLFGRSHGVQRRNHSTCPYNENDLKAITARHDIGFQLFGKRSTLDNEGIGRLFRGR
jgi:hypothetical protein